MHIRTRFSDAGFYDCFELPVITFELSLAGSKIMFTTMVFRWDGQGELINTGILKSNLLDTYHEVGHLECDPKEPNILQFMDTNSDASGDNGSVDN